jgi:hypothetical protein
VTATPELAVLFPGVPAHAAQRLIEAHRAFAQARTRLAAARDDHAAEPVTERLTSAVITTALDDATEYRHRDGGWCADGITILGDELCGEHVNDQATATAYQTLDVITG